MVGEGGEVDDFGGDDAGAGFVLPEFEAFFEGDFDGGESNAGDDELGALEFAEEVGDVGGGELADAGGGGWDGGAGEGFDGKFGDDVGRRHGGNVNYEL